MFLWRDIELASKIDFYGNDYFCLKIQYPDKGTFFLAETFRIFQELLELPVAKISGRNSWFSICSRYLKIACEFGIIDVIRF
jgi:hypothetical protein